MPSTEKNTLGTVALWISIVGIILSVFFVGIPLLVISLILGIIAVFKKPRKAAIASIILSGISVVGTIALVWVFWKPMILPMVDFSKEMETLKTSNVELSEAMEDPLFQEYFSYVLKKTFTSVDWSGVINTNDPRRTQVEQAVRLALGLVQDQLPLALEEWKEIQKDTVLWDESEVDDVEVEEETVDNEENIDEEVTDEVPEEGLDEWTTAQPDAE